jgi:FlaA1/EpsC-like NDP-sugar epimerase
MTTSEAVQLVLQAASIGQAGSVLLLDMGEPIKILDLACDLITLSGYVPHAEVPIVFTGLRKGEKLHEELVVADEGVTPTSHPKILVARAPRPADNGFSLNLSNLVACAQRGERQQVKVLLADLVGTYRPNGEGESADRSADSPPGEALAADAVQGSR